MIRGRNQRNSCKKVTWAASARWQLKTHNNNASVVFHLDHILVGALNSLHKLMCPACSPLPFFRVPDPFPRVASGRQLLIDGIWSTFTREKKPPTSTPSNLVCNNYHVLDERPREWRWQASRQAFKPIERKSASPQNGDLWQHWTSRHSGRNIISSAIIGAALQDFYVEECSIRVLASCENRVH